MCLFQLVSGAKKKGEKEVFLSPGKSEHIIAVFVDITTIDIFYE
jgi:hypothetical protein